MLVANWEGLIKNGSTLRDRKAREIALKILEKVLEEADPKRAVKKIFRIRGHELDVKGTKFNLREMENIYVIGGGKASGGMAETLEEILGQRITKGFVNIPEGTKARYKTSRIELNETSHPIPNENGVEGSRRILQIADEAREKDLVLILISGGGSSLMPLPLEGLSLKDLQNVTDELLKSGAVINELNAVRKHLSGIKGGRLAMACYPAMAIVLIISDVVGDPLDVIASGPTVPDPSTYNDAMEILRKYGLIGKFPRIREHLLEGSRGKIPESLKPYDEAFSRTHNFLIGCNKMVIQKIHEDISTRYKSEVLATDLEGEAREVGEMLGETIMNKRGSISLPYVIISGGETTVTVKGKGVGGRNQELVLGAMSKLNGEGVVIASMGTDGIDGKTDAAGAIADGRSLKKAIELGLSPQDYLDNNDSYNFFKRMGELVMTGPTGTNVNDVIVMVLT
ncbi:MAG: glycerate kinase [Candidatus Hydrothermarchaeales archaeon]